MPTYIGPYEVLEIEGGGQQNRRLKLPEVLQSDLKGNNVFHVSKMKIAKERYEEFDSSIHVPPPKQIDENGEEKFYVESIVNFEDRRNGRYFRVKWYGYNEEHNSWEPADNLTNATEYIKEFFKTNPSAVNPNQRIRKERNATRR